MNRSLLKISILLLLLLSNFASFGMMTKELLQFDFLKLTNNLQDKVVRFFTVEALDVFAQTSKENLATIAQYKEMQKPLIKQYLCAMHKGDVTLAQQIKQDNPNLQLFYCFPSHRLESEAIKNKKVVQCEFLSAYSDMKKGFTFESYKQRRLLLRKQPFLKKAGIFSVSSTSDLDIASLTGDYDLMSTILKEKVSGGKCLRLDSALLLRRALMVAITEHNYALVTMLLDAINLIVKQKDIVRFYFETLQTLKIIGDKEAFALVVNKIPSLTTTYFFSKYATEYSYYFNKPPLTLVELMAEQSDLFDESDFALIKLREKDLLLLETKNKPFDLFELPTELQLMIIRFIRSTDTLYAFAVTSKANYATIEQYKEIQKPLTKKYLCAVHEGNVVLAKQIKRDNPNLPQFYYFPCPGDIFEKEKMRTCVWQGAWPTLREQRIIRKQPWADPWDTFPIKPSPTAMACLLGNYDNVVECLKKKEIEIDELITGLEIAIKEHNNPLCELLLDKINQLFIRKGITIKFYCGMLWMSKKIDRQDIFKLVVNKIPMSFPGIPSFNSRILIERIVNFMSSKSDIFDENDFALVQLRGKTLEEELKQAKIVRRQEDQHCIIL